MRFRDDTKSEEAANLSEDREIYMHPSFPEPTKAKVDDI